MTFEAGSLVRARGREWEVLPESKEDLLILSPLGGRRDEVTGILPSLEEVVPATFGLPDPDRLGDFRSCRLLRDAARLSSRSSAGPFRSFGRIAVEPRPYQIVPLLMALKLEPVRLLIADDVGVGKTVEAILIAREFLDRGEIRRTAVLCPPHLTDQWQKELSEKFHIESEIVLPSTATRLEKRCRVGQSLFDVYPHVIVSMDFIKSDRRRDEFIRTCPEFVIVDEAHTCAFGYEGRGSRHQRNALLKGLASDENRHLVLVTATPHSGKEEAFRSLLSFLDPDFVNLPPSLQGDENVHHRRRLAAHFIQRRRADIRHFLKTETPFPERLEKEEYYSLSEQYHGFFDRVLKFCRETVSVEGESSVRQRVRWWSALALLRSVGSSPAAAASALRNRSPVADAETPEEADELGMHTVFDVVSEEQEEGVDIQPGGDPGDEDEERAKIRKRLKKLALEAEFLSGDGDNKLKKAKKVIKDLLKDGYNPIIFCRFIPTAEYVAGELSAGLGNDVTVECITGLIPPAEREARVEALAEEKRRVLVCTDCLSEGINLQEWFDAVFHYDLSWSPTKHEQREGRVDRFGQKKNEVRVVTYYGSDNPVDGIVLNVLIRKHKAIRSSLGISVPVPVETKALYEAIFEGLLLRGRQDRAQRILPGLEEYIRPKAADLEREWTNAADREKRSRTMFAQESLKPEEVARELEAAREAVGSSEDVAGFTRDALSAHKGIVTPKNGTVHFDLGEVPRALRDSLGAAEDFTAKFEPPVGEGVLYLSRTHPIVESLATYILESALDPETDSAARRAGAIRTQAVSRRTTLLLVRFRYEIASQMKERKQVQLADECAILGFSGSPSQAEWIPDREAERLLSARPDENIHPEQASEFIRRVVEEMSRIEPHIEEEAKRRAEILLDSHRRLRSAAKMGKMKYRVNPKLPPDILGIYVYLPVSF